MAESGVTVRRGNAHEVWDLEVIGGLLASARLLMAVEDHGSGTQLLQEFKLEGLYAVQGVTPEGSKLIRPDAQTATIQNGFVHLPKQAPWRSEYVLELTSFPYGKYSDRVDSTSQALAWIKAGVCAPGMGLFNFMKEAAEALRPRQ